MKRALSIAASLMAMGHVANAASIYVQEAKGSGLQQNQVQQVTDTVKQAVSNMPEHNLAQSEDQADFVLRPSIVQSGDEMRLRIEKEKDGNVLAMSEERIESVSASSDQAQTVTQTAMQGDSFVEQSTGAVAETEETAADDEVMAEEPADRSVASSEEMGTSSATSLSAGDSALGMDSEYSELQGSTTDISGVQSEEGSESAATSSGDMASGMTNNAGTTSGNTTATNNQAGNTDTMGGGQSMMQQPQSMNGRKGPGYLSVGAGPAFALGLDQDDIMISLNAGYNYDLNQRLTAKAFTDLNLSAGSDAGRFWNWGVGADIYPTQASFGPGRPYLTGDVGFAFSRANNDATADGVSIGAGAGYRFAMQQTNVDVNIHYSYLTAEVNGDNPAVLGLRAALNF